MRALIHHGLVAVAVVGVAGGSGCETCTLEACLDVLRLVIRDAADQPVTSFDVEVEIDGEVHHLSCPNPSGGSLFHFCLDEGGISLETDAEVLRVVVTSDVGGFDGEVRPSYEDGPPTGGASCRSGMVCQNATVALTLTE